MLELDLLLSGYLDRAAAPLAASEQADFERLLACQDQLLHDWLIGDRQPEDPALRVLVARIRAASAEPA
jgi:succinate dehydrogenase flavin-adding protein (antitoxin of CptAB toxin-antitoxin module)